MDVSICVRKYEYISDMKSPKYFIANIQTNINNDYFTRCWVIIVDIIQQLGSGSLLN